MRDTENKRICPSHLLSVRRLWYINKEYTDSITFSKSTVYNHRFSAATKVKTTADRLPRTSVRATLKIIGHFAHIFLRHGMFLRYMRACILSSRGRGGKSKASARGITFPNRIGSVVERVPRG